MTTAVYANRRRVQGDRGRQLMSDRGEKIDRYFAHYDTGGMRRTHLRGHPNILLRRQIGCGTPRGLPRPGGLRSFRGDYWNEVAMTIFRDCRWVELIKFFNDHCLPIIGRPNDQHIGHAYRRHGPRYQTLPSDADDFRLDRPARSLPQASSSINFFFSSLNSLMYSRPFLEISVDSAG